MKNLKSFIFIVLLPTLIMLTILAIGYNHNDCFESRFCETVKK